MIKKYIYEYYRLIYCIFFRVLYRTPNVHITTKIEKPLFISRDFSIGEYSYINKNLFVSCKVICGDYVMFGPNVVIAGGDHNFNLPGTPMYFSGRDFINSTIISDDVWVGANCLIKSGVCIGEGAIIGMGSVVTQDVEPYTIVVGNPAKVIKRRFSEDEIIKHKNSLKNKKFKRNYCN
ncbi:galactoside O-acetyltransferase [Photobacterium angustum S14]|uniref:Galactoside O-acetyltransferase n=1 Tax=Photobacterium angustum (strain S14 / CCUG 15956) TaxID=314292 RepID=Q1ZRU5_PHOAS|nr:CatB-related O-acetyltransferase [Photobacterium angustum]EAS65232.1 galactoside O-acetyltransferase [Photobacterium angustum S14]